ncbi:unnamed protein product [Caenorhabditis auriculariae]|uniref:Aminotransferase class I/classII large domain-containing protein n=1 Tax=Caenorhabditis auriculariae TaxID=2777116 RepID=A0A8S1GR08_9PELO|nr:unnamed protein product [Caenorhabditis auriculariae]
MVRCSMSRGVSSFQTDRKPAERASDSKPSIWVEYTQLAVDCKAVNLGQGFPDAPAPKFVTDILRNYSDNPSLTAVHQYTRGYGHPKLVKALGNLYSELYSRENLDPNNEILVTVGAYLALYYTFCGWIQEGDEVIVIEPAYDCYVPQIKMAGGKPVLISMKKPKDASSSSDFKIDFKELRAAITPRTKMLVLNNPNNPIGKLYSREELEEIASIVKENDLIVVADEVYEWHCFEKPMIRFASLPDMYERTISIGSAGKAFSVTGWKLGWAVGPLHLLEPLKVIHQNCVFTCSSPTQAALADAFDIEHAKFKSDPENSYLLKGLSKELKKKRDFLAENLKEAGFNVILPEAGYFMLADFSKFINTDDQKTDEPRDVFFSKHLCRNMKLATIPPSAFYSDKKGKMENDTMIRFFAFFQSKLMKRWKRPGKFFIRSLRTVESSPQMKNLRNDVDGLISVERNFGLRPILHFNYISRLKKAFEEKFEPKTKGCDALPEQPNGPVLTTIFLTVQQTESPTPQSVFLAFPHSPLFSLSFLSAHHRRFISRP